MRDAAVTKDQIDGLFSASAYYYLPQMTLGDHLDIRPTYSDSSNIGGCSFIAHLSHAAAAIDAGLCRVGLIAYASTQRSDGRRLVKSMSEPLAYEVPYGSMWPLTGFAMMARRHMAQFGTTQRQLAEIAVAAREWALLNPESGQTRPLSVDQVVESPEICAPLRRFDCCLVSDGAGALVVTSPEAASDLTDSPVLVWSVAETHDSRYVSRLPDYVTSPAARTGPRALEGAGVALEDIDVFEVYDAFTIAVLIALEDLGFCPKGEGGSLRGGRQAAPRRVAAPEHGRGRALQPTSRDARHGAAAGGGDPAAPRRGAPPSPAGSDRSGPRSRSGPHERRHRGAEPCGLGALERAWSRRASFGATASGRLAGCDADRQ